MISRLRRSLPLHVCAVLAALAASTCCMAQEAHSSDSDAASEAEASDAHSTEEHADADDHGGSEHHDPYDLSHQNAGAQLEDPSEFKSDLAIWTFLLFLCLLAVLAKFAWGPIVAGLDKREQGIAAKIEEAQHSAKQAAKQLQQYESQLAAATEEAKEILAEARRDADSARERIVAEAQEAAGRERDRAIDDIKSAKQVAVQEITERSVDLAVAMAGQLIRREVNADDRAKLVRDALDQIPSQN